MTFALSMIELHVKLAFRKKRMFSPLHFVGIAVLE